MLYSSEADDFSWYDDRNPLSFISFESSNGTEGKHVTTTTKINNSLDAYHTRHKTCKECLKYWIMTLRCGPESMLKAVNDNHPSLHLHNQMNMKECILQAKENYVKYMKIITVNFQLHQ